MRTVPTAVLLSYAGRLGAWLIRPRRVRVHVRGRASAPGQLGPTRFHVSTANGHADFRKAAGARRYAPTTVVRRYQPAVTARASLPRRPAAPLRWAWLAVTGLQLIPRALRAVVHLLLDESATSSRTQRVITDASIRHNMPIHTLHGYGSSDLN